MFEAFILFSVLTSGVPFSTKECIKVKGMHHSCGTMARAKVVAKEDAEVVALLRKAGAIPLCVTNVSELCSWWESSNAVYGRSNNPYNCLRTPGGSTGGEAALQSAAGVPISIGSDTGGSIRIPATFCGLFAHKISGGASSVAGTFVADPPKGWAVTMQSVGPLSRHVDDLLPLVQTLCCSAEEAKRPNLSGDGGDVALSRLRYFFMDGGIGGPGVSPPSPEVKQALHRVVNFIEDYLAVDVRPVRFPAMEGAFQLFEASVEQEVFGYVPAFSEFMNHSVLGEWVCWLLRSSEHELPFLMLVTMEALDGLLDKVRSALGGNPGPRGSISPGDLHRIETFRNEFQVCEPLRNPFGLLLNEPGDPDDRERVFRLLQELLGDDGVLLCPPFPGVATYHGEACMKPLNVMYSAIFNVLGAPATIVPVGLSRKENMPLAVQIVAAPMNDNLTLAVAKMLERPFGGWVPPFSPNSNEFYY